MRVANRFVKTALAAAIAVGALGAAVAGTPGLTGTYVGVYDITVRSADPFDEYSEVQAYSGPRATPSLGQLVWTWDFGNATVTLDDGRLTPSVTTPSPAAWFNYTARDVVTGGTALPFVDNGDGTYTVTYNWSVFPGGFPVGPSADTNITLEITQLQDGSIAVVTVPDAISLPGTPLPTPPFQRAATPDWRGRAN